MVHNSHYQNDLCGVPNLEMVDEELGDDILQLFEHGPAIAEADVEL